MMSISSAAGKRLAKAKAEIDKHNKTSAYEKSDADHLAFGAALNEWCIAANAVADELVEQRFHEFEGD